MSEPVDPMSEPALPNGYLLRKLPLDLPLGASESISCIASYNTNLYIGTSAGNLLHYILFDDADEYILIVHMPVSSGDAAAVKKLLVLPDVDMCLVLANNIVYSFSLPELTPCRVGKIKDANDILELNQVKTAKKNKLDKVIVYASSRILLVQFLPDNVKLLKEISYPGAAMGLSSAAGTLANYSNICLVANKTNYDLVDLQKTQRILLFDFNHDNVPNIAPHIVPFEAQDKANGEEEYMLTICSDVSTSLAMFINSVGDVTRGTITWVVDGYPTNGVTVQWPYIIGLFSSGPESELKLTFSSVEKLEVAYSAPLKLVFNSAGLPDNVANMRVLKVEAGLTAVDRELLDALLLVRVGSRETMPHTKQFLTSHVVFYDSGSLYYLCTETSLVKLIQDILSKITAASDIAELQNISSSSEDIPDKQLSAKVHFLLLLMESKFEEAKDIITSQHSKDEKIDPRIPLLLYEFGDDDALHDFVADKLLIQLTDAFKANANLKLENSLFREWLINEIFVNKALYDEDIQNYFRERAYLEADSTEIILSMMSSEIEVWQDKSPINDTLMTYFESKHYYFVLLSIYQERSKLPDHVENARLIIDISMDLLSKKKTNNDTVSWSNGIAKINDKEFNLVSIVFFELKNNIEDSQDYTKMLLELLKLHPEEGLALLQKNKGGKHKLTHKFILDELSKSFDIDVRFSSLKIEYIEQSFMEKMTKEDIDLALANELLLELLQHLEKGNFQDEFPNLNILRDVFKVENRLEDGIWPKVTWIDFLHLHKNRSECKELISVYLKIFELFVLLDLFDENLTTQFNSIPKLENDAADYLAKIFSPDIDSTTKISFLLELGDFSSAEGIALHGIMPLPRKPILLETVREQLSEMYDALPLEGTKDHITQIVKFYLDVEGDLARNLSVKHIVDQYGRFLGLTGVLGLIPETFPLLYVQDFLVSELVEMNFRRSNVVMTKMLARAEAKHTEKVYDEFTAKLGDLGVDD